MMSSVSGIASDFDDATVITYQSQVVVCIGCSQLLFSANEAIVHHMQWTAYTLNVDIIFKSFFKDVFGIFLVIDIPLND